jgi:hypothetical protein
MKLGAKASAWTDAVLQRYVGDSAVRFFLSLFLPLTLLYAATASWQLPINGDPLTNTITAWHLGKRGTPYLPGYAPLTSESYAGAMGYYELTAQGVVSQYPPGASLLAAPGYALTQGKPVQTQVSNPSRPQLGSVSMAIPPFWPATLVAVIATAAAMAVLGLIFRGQGCLKDAWLAAWVAGLGTSAWSVASDALWQHGPAMLWIAIGTYLAARQRHWVSGLAFGAGVLTRPLTAFIPACVGLYCSFSQRSLGGVIGIGIGSALGLVLLLAYNAALFGEVSVSGGYGTAFENRLFSAQWWAFAGNILGGLFDPRVGLLIWSPFLLLLLPGLDGAWHQSEPWVRGAAVGALVYLLLQYKMNRYLPEFLPYRYPLEALTASAPLWFAAYRSWLKSCRFRIRRLFAKLVIVGIVLQAIAALAD